MGDKNISKYWKKTFNSILNSNIVDKNIRSSIMSTLYGIRYSKDMNVIYTYIYLLISQLE